MKSIKEILIFDLYQNIRIAKYRLFSTCKHVTGRPIVRQPVEWSGQGNIIFKGRVTLGVYPSPYFFNSYIYLEARQKNARIEINDGVWINNNAVIISDCTEIIIGRGALIGTNFAAYDSDFHALAPGARMTGQPTAAPIKIGENVFIGANVTVLKGASIGDNSVIGHGSLVTHSIPPDVIAAGIPAKVIGQL